MNEKGRRRRGRGQPLWLIPWVWSKGHLLLGNVGLSHNYYDPEW